MTNQPHQRLWNANIFHREDGKGVAEIHAKWINYLDEHGEWQPIDCIIRESEEHFSVSDAPFSAVFPLYADQETYFEANCRYDIFEKTRIDEEAVGRFMQCTRASHVRGELFDLNGNGRMDSVIYRNALPDLSADLIYFVQHGRAPRLQQLIRFNAAPSADVEIPFKVRFTHELTIEKVDDGFSHTLRGRRGMGFKPFEIWDSGDGEEQKRQSIRVRYEEANEGYLFTKILPQEFFVDAVFPVFTDDTSTFYPDANPETTSVDGYIQRTGTETWNTGHNAGDGTTAFDSSSASGIRALSYADVTQDDIYRAILVFDTSTLADTITVLSATVSLYVTSKNDDDNDSKGYTVILGSTPASNTSLVIGDYSRVGDAITNPTQYSNTIDTTGVSLNAYKDWTLNATGIAAISLTGVTKFGVREGHDSENVTPGVGHQNGIVASAAEVALTTQDPKLTIVFSAPPTAPSGLTATGANASSVLTLAWTDNSSDEDNFLLERSNNGSTGWAQVASLSANVVTTTNDVTTYDTLRYYRIRAYKSVTGTDFYSSYSSSASAYSAPAVPTSLLATGAAGQVTLTWSDTSTTLTSISIERKIGSGAYSVLTTVSAGVQTYADTSVNDANTYTYRIRAYRSSDGIYSGYSSTSAGSPSPGAPYNLAVTATSATTNLVLTWVDNSTTETNFRVERSTDGSTGWTEINQPAANSTSYTNTVGTSDVRRYYRVRAYRSSDTSYSSYSSTADAYTAPATPSGLSLSRTDTRITLTWTSTSTTATEFRIERSVNGSGYTQIGTALSASFIDQDINTVDTYAYKVRCYRSSDQVYSGYTSPSSSSGSGTVSDITLYGGCIDGSTGAAKIQLLWSSTNVSDDSYLIERSPNGSTSWTTVASVSSSQTTYTDTALTENTTYYYRISNIVSGSTQTTSAVTPIKTTKARAGDLQLAFLHKVRSFPS